MHIISEQPKTRPAEADAWVGTEAAGEILGGVCAMTLRRWKKRYPDFPRSTMIGNRHYYRRSELQAFMARRMTGEAA